MLEFEKIEKGKWNLKINDNISFKIRKDIDWVGTGWDEREIPIYRLSLHIGDSKYDSFHVLDKVVKLYNKKFKYKCKVTDYHHTKVPKYFASMVEENLHYIQMIINGNSPEVDLEKRALLLFNFQKYSFNGPYLPSKVSRMVRDDQAKLLKIMEEFAYHQRAIEENNSKFEYDMKTWNNLPDRNKKQTMSIYDKDVEITVRTYSHSEPGSWSRGAFQDAEDAVYSSGYDVYNYDKKMVPSYKDVANPQFVPSPTKIDNSYHFSKMKELLSNFRKDS